MVMAEVEEGEEGVRHRMIIPEAIRISIRGMQWVVLRLDIRMGIRMLRELYRLHQWARRLRGITEDMKWDGRR